MSRCVIPPQSCDKEAVKKLGQAQWRATKGRAGARVLRGEAEGAELVWPGEGRARHHLREDERAGAPKGDVHALGVRRAVLLRRAQV